MKGKGRPEVFRLLGLARRAGAVAPGTDATRRAIRRGEARLVLMAGDASRVQLDKIRATLGAAIGKAPVAAVAVTDESLATRLLQDLNDAVAREVED